jgi:beta-barrel assembly-enhancing protease
LLSQQIKRITFTVFFLLFSFNLAWAGFISKGWEISIGKSFASALEKEYKVYEDPNVTNIGKRLVEVCSRKDLDYSFKVIDTKEINACSVGGGFIYVNKGLLDFLKDDEDGLAYVLGHELAHVTQRHMVKAIEQQMVGDVLLNIIINSTGVTENASRVILVGRDLLENGYSRKDEFEADRIGVEYTIKAGYNPEGALHILDKFIKDGDTNAGLLDLLRTHPAAPERRDRIKTLFAGDLNLMEALAQIEVLSKAPGSVPLLPKDSIKEALNKAKVHTVESLPKK